MRGAQHIFKRLAYIPRIIPADAGSTRLTGVFGLKFKDHPRGCGEHSLKHIATVSLAGSSPRMRGALTSSSLQQGNDRIIPADAGSTISSTAFL